MTTSLKTVVIADDEEVILRLLQLALKSMGYECVGTAKTGAGALDLIRRLKPQLALLDVHIPESDMFDVTRQVTQLRTTAVVMMTGDHSSELGRQAMNSGAFAFMHKPFESDQLAGIFESAWHRFQIFIALEDKAIALDEALELRKLTEKAKGILMEQQGLSEDEAHRTLLKLSQDQGITLKEVCRSVIQVRMVLGKRSKKVA
jgi:two-component system, response regulator PdtaR